MTNTAKLIGVPVQFGNICQIYPPKVKDVLGNPKYGIYKSLLTTSKDDLLEQAQKNPKITTTEPFDWLLEISKQPETLTLIQEAFQFYTQEPVLLFPDQHIIVIGLTAEEAPKIKSLKDLRILGAPLWFKFQNVVREMSGDTPIPEPLPDDPNEDPRVRHIKEMARLRERIKAKKGSANGIPIDVCITAIFCMGLGITPLNIGEMSYAAINPIMSMYQSKERYQIDVDCALAGSKKAKPVYWIRKQN